MGGFTYTVAGGGGGGGGGGAAAPVITSITPATDVEAGGATAVIAGTDFDPATVTVVIDGNPATVNAAATTTTSIEITVPAGTAGVVDVVVTNGDTQFDTLVGGFTYTVADNTAPTVTFLPAASATDVAITAAPTITFNEAIRKIDDSAVTNSNVASLITFKKNNASGIGVAFTATINTEKTVITITPAASLDNSQVYYLAIGASVEDAADNAITAANASFTTIAAGPAPAVTSSPGISAAEAAAIRAANEAAAKAEAEKLAAAKANADAKAAAEAAAKAAADKAALEKAAAERAVAEKIAAEERAVVEAAVKAEEAKVAAAVAKAAASDVKVVSSKSGTKLTLDLADKYFGKIVTVYVGTKKNGKVTYRALDFFAVDKEDGTASISTKVKLTKGQIMQQAATAMLAQANQMPNVVLSLLK